MDGFNFSASVHHALGQTEGGARPNRRQSRIALSVAPLAVNEAIFLAALRGN